MDQENIPIYAHSKFVQEFQKYMHVNRIGFRRATGQFGQLMKPEKQIHAGIGHKLMFNQTEICPEYPTVTFESVTEIDFQGLIVKCNNVETDMKLKSKCDES